MWNYLAENKYFIFIVFYFIHKSLSAYVIKYQSYPQSDPFLNSNSPANKKKLPWTILLSFNELWAWCSKQPSFRLWLLSVLGKCCFTNKVYWICILKAIIVIRVYRKLSLLVVKLLMTVESKYYTNFIMYSN